VGVGIVSPALRDAHFGPTDRREIICVTRSRASGTKPGSRASNEAFPWETAHHCCAMRRVRMARFRKRIRVRASRMIVTAPAHLGRRVTFEARDRLDSLRVFGSHRNLQRAPSAPVSSSYATTTKHPHSSSLDKECPDSARFRVRSVGRVVAIQRVGG